MVPFNWAEQGSGISSSGNEIIQAKQGEVEEASWDLHCEYSDHVSEFEHRRGP